jgi:hypothetical protein
MPTTEVAERIANRATTRFGDVVRLDELEGFFGRSLRALRPMLQKHGVPIIKIGDVEVVQVAVLEVKLGLVPVEALAEEQEIAAYRARSVQSSAQQSVTRVRARTSARLGTRLVDR